MRRYLKEKTADTRRPPVGRRQKWKVLTNALAVCVAIGTTAALSLPALTLSEMTCGMEEHMHEASCYTVSQEKTLSCTYETLGVHQHTEECYDEAQNLICGYEDKLLHTHDELCYDEAGALVCTLPEIQEHQHSEMCYTIPQTILEEGHTHVDTCWEWAVSTEPTCGLEESAGHIHDETCLPQEGAVICGLEESQGHAHSEACMDEEGNVICGLEESTGHTHDEACQPQEGAPICGLEESEGHTHSEECCGLVKTALLCTEEEREPVIEYGEPELTCQEEEILFHLHDDETCYETVEIPQEGTEEPLIEKVLICTLPVVDKHQHTDACFAEVMELTCQLPEHTHTAECEEQPAKDGEMGLAFIAEDYTTTVIASPEAKLPGNTVITAQPIFDSNEDTFVAPALLAQEASVEEEEPAGKDPSDYAAEIKEAVTWGEVVRIKLFDITLNSGDKEVQPNVPVTVRTEFAEPLMRNGAEALYGVHFGENGLEILPASTERDENGNIVAVTHTQSSFSTTGYVLVHLPNPKDIGPDILPVHYCIWVNDQWIIAGSSRTGWYGGYDPDEDWPPKEGQRDYITLDQMEYILGPYGLKVDSDADRADLSKTIWYQRAEENGKTIRHDTTPAQEDINGESKWVFYLSGNKVQDDGYHIYYVPGGTISGNETNPETTYKDNAALSDDLKQESKFYTLEIRDMNGVVYKDGEEVPSTVTALYGAPVSVTVKPNTTINENGETVNRGWQWVNDKGQVVHGINKMLNGVVDERFSYAVDEATGMETYGFSGIQGRTTLIPYSNAVDGAASDTSCRVDIVVHLDGQWQNVGSLFLQYKKDDICLDEEEKPTWFVTAGQLYTILKDFGFDPTKYTPDDIENEYHKFTSVEGTFAELMAGGDKPMTICDNNQQIDSTTFAVGLGSTEVRDLTLFYLPGSDHESYETVQGMGAKAYAADSALIEGDRYFSVTVKDDYQLVYYGNETEAFKVYARENLPETALGPDGNAPEKNTIQVRVQSGENVLWSVRELWKDDPEHPDYVSCNYSVTPTGGFNVYSIQNLHGPIRIEASSLNPSYTVQYYADIVTYKLYDTKEDAMAQNPGVKDNDFLDIIDTRDGKRPVASDVVPSVVYLQMDPAVDEYGKPIMSTENDGAQVQKKEVHREIVSQAIYNQKDFQYAKSSAWENIDKLRNNDSYEIVRIGILKDGRDPESPDELDENGESAWWMYYCRNNGENIEFTNVASDEDAPHKDGQQIMPADRDYTILLTEGMIIRLHYELVEGDRQIDNVQYFDYDITAGGKAPYDSGIEGINDRSNYPGTDFGKGGSNIANIYAFGNVNCGSGLSSATMNDKTHINEYNDGNNYGCSFGIVQSTLSSDGKLQWNVDAPDIFGEVGNIKEGRYDYKGTLTFKKWGDVYVLSSANSDAGSRSGLEYFFYPSPSNSVIYDGVNNTRKKTILTNDFWVVDNATNKLDPIWGKTTVQFKGRSDGAKNTLGSKMSKASTFPESDDGQNHNSFFGMKFSVQFGLTEDYIGPLSYVFFGDDDMWVYLDGKLICDIGGVHSSVGEYVNIWDYIRDEKTKSIAGTHTLTFYYTERGSSGSTCWMSFTLPSMTTSFVGEGTSSITLSKELTTLSGNPLESNEKYEFTVNLYEDETKTQALNTAYYLEIHNADNDVGRYSLSTGQTILVGAGDVAYIVGLPVGAYYEITEKEDSRFKVKVNGAEGYIAAGTVGKEVNYASFTNINVGIPELPNTGGPGTFPYIFSGWAVITSACGLMYNAKRKKQKGGKS